MFSVDLLAQYLKEFDIIKKRHELHLQRSAESTLRSTKRRAPPPPCANTLQELREDTDVGGKMI